MRPVTPRDDLQAALLWAQKYGHGMDPIQAIDQWLKMAGRNSREWRQAVRKVLGQVGGKSSKDRAEARKKRAVRKAEQARQPKLPFT